MRVRLESEDDVASVASSISGAVNAVLESRLRAGVSQERMDALSGVLKKMAGSLLDKLDENTRVGAFDDFEEEEDEEEDDLWRDNKENTEGNAAQNAGRNADHAAGGTQHCKDEELDQLEKEVAALAAKLHEHRTKVPKLLEDRVEAEVVALRPKEPAHDADEGKDTSVEAALVNEAATASTLHAKLLKASKDIPALRDMLEKSVSRLERTVGNAEEVLEKARSTQPNVVDDDVATPGAGGKTARRHAVATKLIRSSPYLKD